MGGITSSFKDFGIGLIAGLAFLFISRIFGGLGILAAPLLVGSMLKGDRGKTIALMVGFAAIALGGMAATQGNGADEGVM